MTKLLGVPRIFERAPTYAIGVVDDVVITYAYEGSAQDPRHITASAEAIRASALATKKKVRLLAVLTHASVTRPPSLLVRQAIKKAIEADQDKVARAVVALVGEGFGVAVHRAVLSTALHFTRFRGGVTVVGDVRIGLVNLLGAAGEELVSFCEGELAEGRSSAR